MTNALSPVEWRRAEMLFNEAVELPIPDRAPWVAAACPQDPRLAGAVLRMLEADESAGDEIIRTVRAAVNEWLSKPR